MFHTEPWALRQGDSALMLAELATNSFDSMITDPPAGIGLLGLEWDKDKGGRDEWIAWLTGIMRECARVLKPGAHGFVWALPRTSHWTATALEDAGFEVRDVVTHVFGTVSLRASLSTKRWIAPGSRTWTKSTGSRPGCRSRCQELGVTNARLDEVAGVRGGACHWTAVPPSKQPTIPTLERWQKIETLLGPAPEWMKPLLKPAYQLGEGWAQREVTRLLFEWRWRHGG